MTNTSAARSLYATPDESLWRAFETLRGHDALLVCQDYVLALWFLRCLDDSSTAMRPLTPPAQHPQARFVVPADCSFSAIFAQRTGPGLGQRINRIFAKLEAANPSRLAGAFIWLDFAPAGSLPSKHEQERDRRLVRVLETLHALASVGDSVGEPADRLRARLAVLNGKSGSEAYAPREVAQLLAALLNPGPGEHLCDPVCGAGDVLVALAQAGGGTALYGQEADPQAYGRCRLNLLLHRFDNAQIEQGEVLRTPRLVEGAGLRRFDVVAAQLPFASGHWGAETAFQDPYDRFWRGVPPATKGDYAFIAHLLETTRDGHGRAAVVVAHGALYRGGAEGKIRRQLIEENLLDAVIGLPANTYPGAIGPTAVLLFRKGRQTTDVLFIGADTTDNQQQTLLSLTSAQRAAIVSAYLTYQTEKHRVRCVTQETIQENGYNLSLPRYLDDQLAEESADVYATLHTIARLELEQAVIKEQIDMQLRAMGIYGDQ